MIWVVIALLLILIGILVYILHLCFLISKISLTVPFPSTFHEPSSHQEEKVEFATADGTILEARWIPAKSQSVKTIVFCHELGADLNAWHKYAEYLPVSGFNVFAFNFRKPLMFHDGVHQLTTGQWVTRADVEDVLAALRYLTERFDDLYQIGVLGISKGANATLAALSSTCKIKAVVTDGAFTTIETVVDYIKKWISIFVPSPLIYKNAPDWLYRVMVRVSLWISSLKLRSRFVVVEKALHKSTVPIFFIHGEQDSYVSPHQARYLFELTRSREALWVVPRARHNEAVEVLPDEYREKVVAFFEENLR